ncbi:hypothetical protein D3C76_1212070 [compost metagenome]
MLVPTHYPQLDDRRLVRDALENGAYTRSVQAIGQAFCSLILASDANQGGRRTQRGNVQGNVSRTARAVLDLLDLHHRYRCLGRDA